MTYKEFINKLEEYSSFTLNFKKLTEKCLILWFEGEVPIAALSLVNDDWQFLDQSTCFDATFLETMAKLADTPKERRGDWNF